MMNALGKLGRRLFKSIILTAIIILIIVSISAISIRLFLNVNIDGQRSLDLIGDDATEMYQAMMEIEIAQLGYNLTKSDHYIHTYVAAKKEYEKKSNELLEETKKFQLLMKQTPTFVEKGREYQEQFVESHFKIIDEGRHPTKEQILESAIVLQEFRQIYNDYQIHIEDERSKFRNDMRNRINITLITLVLTVMVIIFINVLVNYKVLRSMIRPIIDLSKSVKAYTEHDFSIKVPTYEKNDELSDLIQNIDYMRRELSNNIQSLEHMVTTDALTGLYNRRYFNEHLEKQWEWAKKKSNYVSLIMFDIDHYKMFNDFYGHVEGDKCLQKIAEYLYQFNNPPFKFVSRYGGEEFSVLLLNCNHEQALSISEEIREAVLNLKIPHETSPTNPYVTVSVGVATVIPRGVLKSRDLILMADKALYHSKNNGRNRVTAYSSIEFNE